MNKGKDTDRQEVKQGEVDEDEFARLREEHDK